MQYSYPDWKSPDSFDFVVIFSKDECESQIIGAHLLAFLATSNK
jgi:hypothetical protein